MTKVRLKMLTDGGRFNAYIAHQLSCFPRGILNDVSDTA
jgi:hypothetical protein